MNPSGYVLINGLALAVAIEERGIDKKKLAKSVGVTVETLKNWISGSHKAQRPRFDKLCYILQIPPKVLSSTSAEIVEYRSTKRILRFHMREAAGLNDAPTYREIREITEDLNTSAERIAEEEDPKEEETTLFGKTQPPADSESDNPNGDAVHG